MPKGKRISLEKLRKGADRGKLPIIVERMAAAIKKSHPSYSKSQCIAIAVENLQDNGYLRKGTFKMTVKGRKLAQRMYKREPTAPDVLLKWGLQEHKRKKKRGGK